MTTSAYEIAHTGGANVPYILNINRKLHYTRVTFTGRATGTVTITVKPLYGDRFTAPASNTVNLATTNVWWIKDCPLEAINIDDSANPAAANLGLVFDQMEWA